MKLLNFKIWESLLTEGVNDPGILKGVFLAGGPGSGKSFTASHLFDFPKEQVYNLSPSGLKVVNSDREFEHFLKKAGINPKDLRTMSPAEFAKITTGKDSIRGKAKALRSKRGELYKAGRLGLIIDGTGDKVKNIQQKRNELETIGYDTYMLFVNTNLETALRRNAMRSRSLPDALVKEIWNDVQDNIGKFQLMFGDNMIVIDNSSDDLPAPQIKKAINKWLKKPIQNPIGKKWIKDEKEKIKRK